MRVIGPCVPGLAKGERELVLRAERSTAQCCRCSSFHRPFLANALTAHVSAVSFSSILISFRRIRFHPPSAICRSTYVRSDNFCRLASSPLRQSSAQLSQGLITLMYLATILVVSLFAQCNAYQPSTLRRLGPPASSSFAINHQTPSLPGWLTRLHVNNLICPSHSPWRLFSTADKEGGNDLALPSLDFSSNPTVFDFVNKVVEDMARAGIPEEIKNKVYASERELRMDLENVGLDDLYIILNQDGFPIWKEMPCKVHVGAVGEIIDSFDEWKNGRPIKCRTKVNIFVNDSFNRPPNEKRCPDFAIFGPDRLTDTTNMILADTTNRTIDSTNRIIETLLTEMHDDLNSFRTRRS